jgi:recombinational DNA repair ATPase RecF
MATTKSDSKNAAIRTAREAVRTIEDKLNKLHSDFELEKREREQLLKSLEYELSNCRNGTQREPLHNKIEETKKETATIFKIWQKDIYDCGLEVVDRRSDLRVLMNDVFDAEYRKFKDSLDMNAAFRAFAFHRQTFEGGKWSDFLHSLFREPNGPEIDAFADEVDEAVA